MVSRSTLGDGAPEQPLCTRHGKQNSDAHRPSRLAEDGDVAGIATKSPYILLYPREGGELVEQTEVCDSVAEIQETLSADAIIDGYAYDTIAGETTAVIPGRRTRSVILKHAARNPDHHRLPSQSKVAGPDVKVQTVFTGNGKLGDEHVHRRPIRQLRRLPAISKRVSHAAPG